MEMRLKSEATVGLLVIVAAAVFFTGLMWLSGKPLTGARRLEIGVRFDNIEGLTEGDPVQLSGFQIGRVKRVELESPGEVLVFLELDSQRWAPRIDATAEVRPLDFLGQKYVAYSPGQSSQAMQEGQIITGSIETGALESASGLADQAGAVLTGLQGFVQPDVLDQLMATMQATERALNQFARTANNQIAPQASAALARAESAIGRVDSILANPAIEQSVNQLDEVMEGMRDMMEGLAGVTTQMNLMMQNVSEGGGTLGLMMSDSTMYGNLNDVLVAMRRLLDDMRERPGRYFRLKVF